MFFRKKIIRCFISHGAHWAGIQVPSLQIFKTRLDKVLCSLLWVTLLQQGGWTRWPTEVPSNPERSVILWFPHCWEIAVWGANGNNWEVVASNSPLLQSTSSMRRWKAEVPVSPRFQMLERSWSRISAFSNSLWLLSLSSGSFLLEALDSNKIKPWLWEIGIGQDRPYLYQTPGAKMPC